MEQSEVALLNTHFYIYTLSTFKRQYLHVSGPVKGLPKITSCQLKWVHPPQPSPADTFLLLLVKYWGLVWVCFEKLCFKRTVWCYLPHGGGRGDTGAAAVSSATCRAAVSCCVYSERLYLGAHAVWQLNCSVRPRWNRRKAKVSLRCPARLSVCRDLAFKERHAIYCSHQLKTKIQREIWGIKVVMLKSFFLFDFIDWWGKKNANEVSLISLDL